MPVKSPKGIKLISSERRSLTAAVILLAAALTAYVLFALISGAD